MLSFNSKVSIVELWCPRNGPTTFLFLKIYCFISTSEKIANFSFRCGNNGNKHERRPLFLADFRSMSFPCHKQSVFVFLPPIHEFGLPNKKK